MNVFAALEKPLVNRPASGQYERPPAAPKVSAIREKKPKKPKPPGKRRVYPEVKNSWGLSAAQCATLGLIANGYTHVEAAAELGVSVGTIEARVSAARNTMAARTSTHAAVMYDRLVRAL